MNQNLIMKNSEIEELLFSAVQQQDYKSLVELCSQIDNITFTNNSGQTLLHVASFLVSEHTLPIVQLLLNKGSDPNSVDENFKTPFEIAQINKNFPALSLMKYYALKGSVS